jgi:class 3 adenylate cyclase
VAHRHWLSAIADFRMTAMATAPVTNELKTLAAMDLAFTPTGLRFAPETEADFKDDYFEKTANATRRAAIGGLIMYVAFGALDYWLLPESYQEAWALRFGLGTPFYALMIAASFLARPRRFLQFYVSAAMFLCGFTIVLMIALSNPGEVGHEVYFAGVILVHIGGYVFLNLRFPYAAVANLAILISYEVAFLTVGDGLGSHEGRLQFLSSNFFLVGANILGIWSCYRLDYFARRDYALRQQSERLLLNILPEEIATRLKSEPGTVAGYYPEASILFADVVGFTPSTAAMEPEDLIDLLNEVFSFFDDLVEKHGVEKIKTVGDAYMAAAGVPLYRPDHAQALARMALEITDYVATHTFRGKRLGFRIGINSGPVVAGVIGRMKFSYDLWGDTVNMASRMESHGEENCIQIAAATYELIKDEFVCEPRGAITLKGIGEVETWLLIGERRGPKERAAGAPTTAAAT